MFETVILPLMLDDVFERVEIRLKKVGLSAQAASKKAGLSQDAIRNLRRAAKEKGREGVSTKTITALAPVLETSVEWLLTGKGAGSEGDLKSIDERVRHILPPEDFDEFLEDVVALAKSRAQRAHKN
jgi:transcriptional regulator with XRE-family HTH domain